MDPSAPSFRLLDLPDPCVLAVLRCCAASEQPPRSLCSAARAHSRLHEAAVSALTSIRAVLPPPPPQQQQHLTQQEQQQLLQRRLGSLLLYLAKHGQHVDSILIDCSASVQLRELPHSLQQLRSLTLRGLELQLQLQPGDGFGGVVWQGLSLTRLCLELCTLLDREEADASEEGSEGLAAALKLLPGLEHLSLRGVCTSDDLVNQEVCCRADVLAGLQRLTHLDLFDCVLYDPDDDGMRWLQGLTRLQYLRLGVVYNLRTVAASTLSGLQGLTRLELEGRRRGDLVFEPAVLAGRPHLQHLALVNVTTPGGTAGVAALLRQLQQLQQLTHLEWRQSQIQGGAAAPTAAAAYAALTASSKLQHLDISRCTLPEGVWQHMFPPGRQLPHLRKLCLARVTHPEGSVAAPEGSTLVSCCPGLQSLQLHDLQLRVAVLAPLSGLRGLSDLSLTLDDHSMACESLQMMLQLTGLRRLNLECHGAGCMCRQLTQLRQLTALWCTCSVNSFICERIVHQWWLLERQGPDSEPVWRQLQQKLHSLDHG